jgi:hypothetical protein
MKIKVWVQLIASTVFFLASWWCFLWMLASADMAFVDCDGKYSLFHERFRCRQPDIAFLLWVGFGVACVSLLYFGVKNLRKEKDHEQNP